MKKFLRIEIFDLNTNALKVYEDWQSAENALNLLYASNKNKESISANIRIEVKNKE